MHMLQALIGFALVASTQANVIGLDFGTEFMKIAIVQPGSPLEIVTNLQSKRKTETVVTFYKGDRFYGWAHA
jgi:hypoxia up-regulated 1